MDVFRLRIIFSAIALLSAFGNLGVPFVLSSLSYDFPTGRWDAKTVWTGFLDGLLIGEFLAIAVWILFDAWSLSMRLLIGAFLGLFLAGCLILGFQVWPGLPMAVCVFIMIVGSVLPFVFAGFLYGARRLSMNKNLAKLASQSESRSRQYGIGFLLAVMFAVALAITLIRWVLRSAGKDGWLDSNWEFVFLGLWFFCLSMSVTLFMWFPFLSVFKTTSFNLGCTLVLTILFPSFFHWISGFLLFGRLSPGTSFRLFSAFPQSMSFGVLTSSLLLGTIIRLCVCTEPEVEAAIDSALQA